MLIPRTKVPDLKFPLTNNSEFDLHKENPKSFNLIVAVIIDD